MQQLPLLHAIECPDPGGKGSHTLAYWEWPNFSAKRTVVCVHGLTRQGRDFDALAKELSREYRVLSVDVAGRGKSARLKDKSMYHYGTYVADMIVFMETLGLKETFWIGTSMGGLIGMILASTYPEYITKLVMNDIGPHLPEAALRRIASYVGQPVAFSRMDEAEKYLRETLNPWGIKEPMFWRQMAEHSFISSGGKLVPHYDPAIRDGFANIEGDVEMWDLWSQVKCPTLVLRGGVSDLLSAATFRRMQERPGVSGTEFQGIGHAPSLMNPEQIGVVKKWLAGGI